MELIATQGLRSMKKSGRRNRSPLPSGKSRMDILRAITKRHRLEDLYKAMAKRIGGDYGDGDYLRDIFSALRQKISSTKFSRSQQNWAKSKSREWIMKMNDHVSDVCGYSSHTEELIVRLVDWTYGPLYDTKYHGQDMFKKHIYKYAACVMLASKYTSAEPQEEYSYKCLVEQIRISSQMEGTWTFDDVCKAEAEIFETSTSLSLLAKPSVTEFVELLFCFASRTIAKNELGYFRNKYPSALTTGLWQDPATFWESPVETACQIFHSTGCRLPVDVFSSLFPSESEKTPIAMKANKSKSNKSNKPSESEKTLIAMKVNKSKSNKGNECDGYADFSQEFDDDEASTAATETLPSSPDTPYSTASTDRVAKRRKL
eukprot:GEMP01003907.1.p1 GENE.GEMP01003907.1~~GEMP01003907.1.p1  ORF type:complete len:373 (+),score=50.70 GEMP01003907.1:56-1174(+)